MFKEEVLEIHILNQETVRDQIKGFIIRLFRQMVTTTHPIRYPRTDCSTIFGATGQQPILKPIPKATSAFKFDFRNTSKTWSSTVV